MNGEKTVTNWWNRSIYDEPRGGTGSWVVLGFAVLYAVFAPLYDPLTAVLVPIVFLFAIPEVLPSGLTRIAVALRVLGLVYILLVPVLVFSLGSL